jgi:hypothetical protein
VGDEAIQLLSTELALVAQAAKLTHHGICGGYNLQIGAKNSFCDAGLQNGSEMAAPAIVKVLKNASDCWVPPGADGKFCKNCQLLWGLLETQP